MRVIIDYELVYDVWSLMFCILRMDDPNLRNEDYTQVFYKDPVHFFSDKQLLLFK